MEGYQIERHIKKLQAEGAEPGFELARYSADKLRAWRREHQDQRAITDVLDVALFLRAERDAAAELKRAQEEEAQRPETGEATKAAREAVARARAALGASAQSTPASKPAETKTEATRSTKPKKAPLRPEHTALGGKRE